jgi:CRP-like cAMP-binding protein
MAENIQPQQGFWAALHEDEQAALAAVGTNSTYAPGRYLLHDSDGSRDIAVIRSGLVKAVARGGNAQQVVLAIRGPGDIVGELANINGGRRSAAVVALNRVDALAVRCDAFTAFLNAHPYAAQQLHRTVVDRLCEADRDRLAAAWMSVGQRLARFVLKVINRYGVPSRCGGRRIDQLSQGELAACVGGGRRTVAREIGDWRMRRIVSTDRRSLIVHDQKALSRIAGRHAPPP